METSDALVVALKGWPMGLFDKLRFGGARRTTPLTPRGVRLELECLEDRISPDISGVLSGTTLVITGTPVAYDRIAVKLDSLANQLVLSDFGVEQARFDSSAVHNIVITAAARNSIVQVDAGVLQPATIRGGPGTNLLYAGGGPTTLVAGPGVNRLTGGSGDDLLDGSVGDNTLFGGDGKNTLIAGSGRNIIFGAKDRDVLLNFDPSRDTDLRSAVTPPNLNDFLGLAPSPVMTLTTSEVGTLLDRAAAATASDDGIVAVVDRGGRILGVRVEGNVAPAITGDTHKLVFAIDGAIAEARTGAFFSSNQAPLTSRTIQFISQSTITQREVESDPSIADLNSTVRGPGFVAPIGIGGHFPPNVPFTPQVDLFGIENTNRDTSIHPGPNGIIGGPGSMFLPARFNIDPAFIPSRIPVNQRLAPPDSYSYLSGLEVDAQPRGIGTLPGGIPIYKDGVLVGGIGVFFPGKTGFADEENSALSTTFDPSKRDRALEAEYVAFAALGGSSAAGFQIGALAGIAPLPGFDLPFGRIDLVGITLPIYGPNGQQGTENLVRFGQSLGIGNPNSGVNEPLLQPGADGRIDPSGDSPAPGNLLVGTPVPEGWLVTPHDGQGVTAAQVQQIVAAGVEQAVQTRAAIRLPLDSTTRMIFAVTDQSGQVLGLFRMPDATVFSLDVAVAKARNVAYYADPAQLQPIDQAPGVPPGVAFTNRTFRFLSEPFFPEGINGAPPGPFSILNDGGVDPRTGAVASPALPASAFQTVFGHDAFNPQTNFRDPNNILNQNGIVFFPGSAPLYSSTQLIGGFGVSGDGVDQDDVVTSSGQVGFEVPGSVLRADQVFVNSVRLPYQKFNRQPLEP